jgi:superoxide reductase
VLNCLYQNDCHSVFFKELPLPVKENQIMDKRDFIRVSIAGAAGALFVPRILMAGMVEPALKTRLAGGVYHTAEAFGRWNKKISALHLADTSKQGNELHVESHHPMDGYKHYIIKHQLLDAHFRFITEHRYDPLKDKKPRTVFNIKDHKGLIYVITMCNIHDVWINAHEV